VRIVSLLPSATEILFALGAGPDVVGVTFECDFPSEARTRTIVSNTTLPAGLSPAQIDAQVRARLAAGEDLYTLDADALRTLDPDLVVTQDLCAVCAVDVTEVDRALDYLGCRGRVVTLDPMSLSEVLESVTVLGHATGHVARGDALVESLRARLESIAAKVRGLDRPRVALLEWTDPPFSSGHWVPDMVQASGAESVLGQRAARSVQITWHDVEAACPDIIVVAPCGYRLEGARRLAEEILEKGLVPAGVPLWAVDADAAFVRPGPRVVDGIEALAHIAHPAVIEPPAGLAVMVRDASVR